MLHGVLYPQVHDNGIKKKKKKELPISLNGPIADHEKRADILEWAHYCS
jgi:hypothetical protein